MPIYDFTAEFARLAAPAARDAGNSSRALRHDQEQTDRFFGTIAGTVPMAEFFARDGVAAGVA